MEYINLNLNDINLIGNGVSNCGMSCFFNSVNQMLFHIPEFREFLVNNNNKFSNELVRTLILLFIKMKEGNIIKSNDIIQNNNGINIDLNTFYLDIQEKVFFNRSPIQQDSLSYFLYIMNSIYEDIYNNENILIPKLDINNISNIYAYKSNLDFCYLFLEKEKTFCKNKNDNLLEKNKISTQLYFNIFGKLNNDKYIYELNDINNNIDERFYSYERCNIYNYESYQNISYETNSKYIFFSLSVLQQSINNMIVTINGIQLTSTNINKLPYLNINGVNYELIGTVIQSGDLDGGHYWYNHKINNKWYTYNDHNHSQIFDYDPTDNIRIMLFRKVNESYSYLNYNYDNINKIILKNTQNFYITKDQNSSYINKNLEILVYYVNFYNKTFKYKNEINEYTYQLKQNILNLI